MCEASDEDHDSVPGDWIRRSREGERDALELLMRHLHAKLQPWTEHVLGGAVRRFTEPEDVLQQALVNVSQKLQGMEFLPTEKQLISFTKRAVHFCILDAHREFEGLEGESALDTWSAIAQSGASEAGAVTRHDGIECVRRLVACLPEEYSHIVRASALEGATFVEIAAKLGLQPDTVRKRYTRALKLLERELESRRID